MRKLPTKNGAQLGGTTIWPRSCSSLLAHSNDLLLFTECTIGVPTRIIIRKCLEMAALPREERESGGLHRLFLLLRRPADRADEVKLEALRFDDHHPERRSSSISQRAFGFRGSHDTKKCGACTPQWPRS